MKEHITLSMQYARGYYAITFLITLIACVMSVFKPSLIPVFLLIKIFSSPVVLYLQQSLRNTLSLYFYINLGFSKLEYYILPIILDLLSFVVLMTTGSLINHFII